MTERLAIASCGARTALGLDLVQTAFLLRAGCAAVSEAALVDRRGRAVGMAHLATLDPFATGIDRLVALAAPALVETVGPIAHVLASARVRCAWLCGTDGGGHGAEGERTLAAELAAVLRGYLPGIALEREPAPDTPADARAPAWQQAFDALAAGACDALLVGGVHSDYHPGMIAALEASGRLAPPGAEGVVPGEAAAFAVVCGAERLRAARCAPRGWVLGYAALGGDDDAADARVGVARARAVAGALEAACSSARAQAAVPVGWVVSDTTTERASVRSWLEAARACPGLWRDPCELTTPAEQLGRLGSAAMPLALGLITEGFVRGFAGERSALGLASDTPDVAVVLVAAA